MIDRAAHMTDLPAARRHGQGGDHRHGAAARHLRHLDRARPGLVHPVHAAASRNPRAAATPSTRPRRPCRSTPWWTRPSERRRGAPVLPGDKVKRYAHCRRDPRIGRRRLLQHQCKTIPKESLHLPGPDFVERIHLNRTGRAGARQAAVAVRSRAAGRHRLRVDPAGRSGHRAFGRRVVRAEPACTSIPRTS